MKKQDLLVPFFSSSVALDVAFLWCLDNMAYYRSSLWEVAGIAFCQYGHFFKEYFHSGIWKY